MFKFLKEKLKGALTKISKDVEEEIPDEVVETPKEEKQEVKKKPAPKKKPKKEKKEPEIKEEVEEKEEKQEEKKGFLSKIFKKKEEEQPEEVEEEKKGFFAKLKEKVVTKKISTEKFDKLFWELELALLENNVAVEVVEKIKTDLKEDLVDKPINRAEVSTILHKSLKKSVEALLKTPTEDLVEEIKKKKEKPYVIAFIGVNGSGKTTTIARMTHLLQQKKLTCVLVAADTFRAGAKEQLKEWATKLKVNVIAHDYGADPAAVCYDGIEYGKKQKADVVLIDTAGRQHSNVNLIKQMEKIMRIAKPDKKIFVGESITGNDVVTQAKAFDQSVGIDGIILTKADVDEKGGATISVSYVTGKPILYIGTGQELGDLEPFDPEKIITTLGL
tara:strand:+ start:16717 stop:17880 length:1164 start_codon:yes stop_codon:yes gene_type:complete